MVWFLRIRLVHDIDLAEPVPGSSTPDPKPSPSSEGKRPGVLSKPALTNASDVGGTVSDDAATFRSDPVPIPVPASLPPTDDPDYVWDVFYLMAGLTDDYDHKADANVGTLCVFFLVLFYETYFLSGNFSTGLPASFDDPYSSDEESEEEDEADEDSNGVYFQ